MRKFLGLMGILILLVSCKKEGFKYNYFSTYTLEGSTIISAGDILNNTQKETGEWTFKVKGGKLISKGKFDNGIRTGLWSYSFHRDTTVNIDWITYKNDTTNLIVNYPKDWQLYYVPKYMFLAALPTSSLIKENKLAVISYQLKDSIKMSLDEYLDFYNKQIADYRIIKNYNFNLQFDNTNSYYSFANYFKDNEEILNLSYICEDEKGIYDITFISLNTDPEIKNQIFIDFVSGMYVNGKRLFDPMKQMKINMKL